ncbi:MULTISPECIES: hypothetical protein [Proteus]|uniref:hypothetical protein n=1 Tax=Proteus TaxID=583 RepID=UPI000C9DBE97|nr:hypothetical protein [Proteus terrae]MDY3693594.1 hypothetical protein [Proteus mirabilis]PNL48722.1 hypothetical protein CEP63_005670 [Proteus mirabilis]
MKTEHIRSIQTISHSTEVINTFIDDVTNIHLSIHRLIVRKDHNKQLFIVIIQDDNKSDDFYIVPFTELSYRKEKINIIVDPYNQYPELNGNIIHLLQKIKSSIFCYMSKYQNLSIH